MWVDPRGNWHIINHCYDNHEWENCSTSVLSSHFFSQDGKTWHFLNPPVQPYSHTVQYDDGSSHMFVTMERPNVFLDESGQVTHIHLAADLVTGDEGCGNDPKRQAHAHFGHVPCDNCKVRRPLVGSSGLGWCWWVWLTEWMWSEGGFCGPAAPTCLCSALTHNPAPIQYDDHGGTTIIALDV